jgi:hypothetical protein
MKSQALKAAPVKKGQTSKKQDRARKSTEAQRPPSPPRSLALYLDRLGLGSYGGLLAEEEVTLDLLLEFACCFLGVFFPILSGPNCIQTRRFEVSTGPIRYFA